jgi:hypothetical protein
MSLSTSTAWSDHAFSIRGPAIRHVGMNYRQTLRGDEPMGTNSGRPVTETI